MKTILSKALIGRLIISALLTTVIACTPDQRSIVPGKVSESTQAKIHPNPSQNATNLVALFFVKKDNTKNELRGEIYPIALLLNGRYVEVSQDVTLESRSGETPGSLTISEANRLVEGRSQRIVLNAVKDFTVISDRQKLGNFQVEKPIVSQFTCSSVITGQGNFQGQTSLQTVFDQIPKERESRFNGYIRPQKYDETWRSAIALSQAPSLSKSPAASEADLTKYRQDLLTLSKAAIAKGGGKTNLPDEAVVESMQVVDLDRDGSPEIFGKVRQESANQAPASPQNTPIGTATIWVNYKDGKLQLMETIQAGVGVGLNRARRFSHDLLETIDLNGDGVDEVIAKRTGYESISFEIYEYKNNQLDRVFNGAGYGC